MKQRLNFITIGVNDLAAMKAFYEEKFGWTATEQQGDIVFFQLNGFILSLYPAGALAEDIGIAADGEGFRRFTLAINFSDEAAVDAAFEALSAKGVDITKPPQKVFWGGYSGYVSDPEGNYWELAYNPFLALDEQGSTVSHGS